MTQELKARLSRIRHVALDMDGTIYLGETLFPYTIPFLEKLGRLGITYSFLTNNPSKSISDYIAKLHRLGVPCSEEQMYSTCTATIDHIKAHYPGVGRVFVLGTPSMVSQFENAGFRICTDSPDDRPELIVAAFDTTLTHSKLCRFAWWASHKDIPYLATNPDWVCPTDQPTILVDCGSICKCIEGATGRKPDLVIGKPNKDILLGVIGRKGLGPDEVAMVGDRLYTDVKTALNAGATGVLVLSGESTLQTVAEAAPDEKPTLVCQSIEELGNLLEESHK